LGDIPDHLWWPDVRRLIDSIDGTDSVGKRDRAPILLAATTGMRNAGLRRLEIIISGRSAVRKWSVSSVQLSGRHDPLRHPTAP
jgi:integrase